MDVSLVIICVSLGFMAGWLLGSGQGYEQGKKEGKAAGMKDGKVEGVREYLRRELITNKPLSGEYASADEIISQAKKDMETAIQTPLKKGNPAPKPSVLAWLLLGALVMWMLAGMPWV
ncbi:MAG: hypothetical protein JG718_16900 [Candidatus Thiothrix moscowensis]|nr:hypothetical protein [Candidatus Thiothrix moscowensis]